MTFAAPSKAAELDRADDIAFEQISWWQRNNISACHSFWLLTGRWNSKVQWVDVFRLICPPETRKNKLEHHQNPAKKRSYRNSKDALLRFRVQVRAASDPWKSVNYG